MVAADLAVCFVAGVHFFPVPASKKPDDRQFKVDDKIRVNLHQGKIEDAVVRAVIQDDDGTKLWSIGRDLRDLPITK